MRLCQKSTHLQIALDLEELCKHDSYLGKRVKRGLFLSKNSIKINADLNGAINILRKVTRDKEQGILAQTQPGRGQVTWPTKASFCKENIRYYKD